MRKIKALPITSEAFAPYGCFADALEPKGEALCGPMHSFYRENARFFSESTTLGFSPITVRKPDQMVITCAEYHNKTCEAIVALNDDFLLHVAPANGGTPEPEKTVVFRVPKGVVTVLYPGVWHLCPLPASEPVLHALILLPDRTYVNDFYCKDFAPGEAFEIEP